MADQYKFWQKRESRNNMKVGKNQKAAAAAAAATNILEAISQLSSGEAAAPRQMKIVVRKEELEQVLQAIRDGRSGLARRGAPPAAVSLEQRLSFMRRRHILRAAGQAKARNRSGSWSPVLQSIPEEL